MYIATKKTVVFVSGGAISDDSDTKSLIPKYLKLTNLISVKTPRKWGLKAVKYNIYAKNMQNNVTFIRKYLEKSKRLFNFAPFFVDYL